MFQGRAYHSALATNFKNKFEKEEDLPMDDVLDVYSTYWEAYLSDHIVEDDEEKAEVIEFENVDWADMDKGAVKDEGVRVLKMYMKNIAGAIIPSLVPETEMRKEIPDSNIMMVTIPDLITTKVIDHKLAGRRKSQSEADSDAQASFYSFVTGLNEFEFHVGVRKLVPEIQIVKTDRSNQEIDWWLDLARNVGYQMDSGIFVPNPTGWWCQRAYCGYFDICRGRK